MARDDATDRNLWKHREAADVRTRDRIAIALLTGVGIVAVVRMLDWWFRREHVAQPILFAALSIAVWYGIGRMVLGWVNYLAIRKPPKRNAPAGMGVAIFTTSAPGEPLSMFEKTLAACARIEYPHNTYLLDDTRDPLFREMAERHGATWLEIVDVPGAKAGKINRALESTTEDFILVLDPDHIPFPEFLDRVLGHFDHDDVGFVQVAQAYYNQRRSFTARSAAEQTYGFYGPGQMGLFGHGAAVAIGANCTFRRKTLEAIGGHGIGLAEDLVTAIRIHAAGWRSIYVPEILSRGLVPEDLGSYYRQQLKWARGVYEVVFAEMPRLFVKLSWRQRLAYTTIGTYYLSGAATLLYLIFPYLFLWMGLQPASMQFDEFLSAAGPVGVIGMLIYFGAQRWLCHPRMERGTHWRGLSLKVASWPIFLAGTVLAITRTDIPYIPTAKEAVRGRFLLLALPQVVLTVLYLLTVLHVVEARLATSEGALELTSQVVWGMVGFATLPVLMAFGPVRAAWESTRIDAAQPWNSVDVGSMGGDPPT
ncbi:MAG: glycosyltransferase family 2 protein [Gemmatimonadales bacterium]